MEIKNKNSLYLTGWLGALNGLMPDTEKAVYTYFLNFFVVVAHSFKSFSHFSIMLAVFPQMSAFFTEK